MYDLSSLGLIKVEGPDAEVFLQGQITCNVKTLPLHYAQLSAYCNPQGRIVSLFYLVKQNQDYFFILPKNIVEITFNTLKKYAIFFKVNLLIENKINVFGFVGKSEEINSDCYFEIPSNHQKYFIFNTASLSCTQDYSAWKKMELQENIFQIYPETSGKWLPHDCQLHELNAISFNKGCFTGQEIIARMQYRAKLKNKLQAILVDQQNALIPGQDFQYAENINGIIIDAHFIQANQQYVLILTRA